MRIFPKVLALLLAQAICLLQPVAAGERAVLRDGRYLSCESHQSATGGWLVGLTEGGSVFVAGSLVARFEQVPQSAGDPLAQAIGAPPASALIPTGVVSATAPATETLPELASRIARELSMDPKLVEAVIHVESGFDRFAVSPKGAGGLMQLMPATADRFQVRDVFDPVENIRGGVRYLKLLSDRFQGDLGRVLAAYNAGEGAVERHVGIPPYRETRQYVIHVLEQYLHPRPPRM